MKLRLALSAAILTLSVLAAHAAPIILQQGTYGENFDGMNTSGTATNPLPGWDIRTGATPASLGNVNAPWPGALRAWSHASGQGKNVSSANIPSTSTAAEQTANTNRALGLRQVSSGSFDPGVSLNFNFATSGLAVQQIKLDLLMLDVTARSTTFELQVGNGTTFTTLHSWSDPGAWGSATVTLDRSTFGSALDDQSSLWFRFVALTPATGSGSTYDMVALDNFSVTTGAIPEPSTCTLIGLAALGVVLARRRAR